MHVPGLTVHNSSAHIITTKCLYNPLSLKSLRLITTVKQAVSCHFKCLSFKQGHPSQASSMCFDRYGDVTPGERSADGDSVC